MHRPRERVGTRLCGPAVALGLLTLGLWGCNQAAEFAEFACGAGDVACLIEAINEANANGKENTITLAAGTYPLTAAHNNTDGFNGLPSVTSPLTIMGAGAEATVIARVADFFRLFHVATAGRLTLEGLTLTGGAPISSGGGIFNRGTLTLVNTALTDNTAGFFYGGGGLYNEGTVTIIDSTLARNSAGMGGGGGLQNSRGTVTVTNATFADNQTFGRFSSGSGGGLYNAGGMVTVTNATFAGNSAGSGGGGVTNSGGTVRLINSTLTGNSTVGDGGGLRTLSGTVALQNTILAGNTAQRGGPDCAGPVTSRGTNVIGDIRDCAIPLQASDLVSDPRLGAFTDDGTPGRGHVPVLPESPAIDAGNDDACPPTDQLGQPRVGPCDIGAIEF